MIRLSKSSIGPLEKEYVMSVLDKEYLGMGAEVGKFEAELTEYFGRPAVCVANGTAALQLAIQALHIGPGDEVLVPSLTYVASYQAITANGATAVPVDLNPATLLIDIKDIEKKITANTKAIMPVHYASNTKDLDAIYSLAEARGLRVIEDAAQSMGSTHHGKKVGSFGDVACFSFDGIKNMTSGEGGCVVSSDPEVIQRVSDLRLGIGICF